ncbi:MAG: hypothetical protein ABI612_01985, partial [Betaproteobacteria bacterium]
RRAYEQQKGLVISKLVSDADMFRASGELAKAEANYRKAQQLDPNNVRIKMGLTAVTTAAQNRAAIEQARIDIQAGSLDKAESDLRVVLKRDPTHAKARDLLAQIADARSAASPPLAPAEIKSPFTKPITLEFRDASLKSVFEVMSRTSGLNFVFDRDVRSDTKINIFVRNTSLDDVIKLILTTNQLDRKLLNENSVLIYPNTPAKQKEYRELVVRSFYLANADVKQAVNLVKGMVKSQDVFMDEKLNLMVVKDTPEAMSVVEKLMRSLDLAEPEVMLELEVLEVSTTRLQQLGIQFPQSVSFGNPAAAVGGDTSTTSSTGSTPPANVRLSASLVAFTTNPPFIVNLLGQDSDAKVLANPRIRVRNREKAKVHIGSRVPVVTTTSTANVGVSSSVSYLDVGLKLDVEPNIYLRDEVAIKIGLEVSNITRTLDLQGTRAYELGTRNTATVLQIKDGETQILAGLINDEDRRSANKVPGLGDIPILGRLFSSQNDDRTKTEIVLLITPRIVRSLDWSRSVVVDQPVGTDSAIGSPSLRISRTSAGDLSLAPADGTGGGVRRPNQPGGPGTAQIPAPSGPGAVPQFQQIPAQTNQSTPSRLPQAGEAVPQAQPQAIPQTPSQLGSQSSTAQPAPTSDATASESTPSLLIAAPLAARSGSEVLVSIGIPPGTPAVSARMELSYDPSQLEPLGAAVSAPGRLPLKVDGSAAVRFKVLAPQGRAQLRIDGLAGTDVAGAPIAIAAPAPIDVTITP